MPHDAFKNGTRSAIMSRSRLLVVAGLFSIVHLASLELHAAPAECTGWKCQGFLRVVRDPTQRVVIAALKMGPAYEVNQNKALSRSIIQDKTIERLLTGIVGLKGPARDKYRAEVFHPTLDKLAGWPHLSEAYQGTLLKLLKGHWPEGGFSDEQSVDTTTLGYALVALVSANDLSDETLEFMLTQVGLDDELRHPYGKAAFWEIGQKEERVSNFLYKKLSTSPDKAKLVLEALAQDIKMASSIDPEQIVTHFDLKTPSSCVHVVSILLRLKSPISLVSPLLGKLMGHPDKKIRLEGIRLFVEMSSKDQLTLLNHLRPRLRDNKLEVVEAAVKAALKARDVYRSLKSEINDTIGVDHDLRLSAIIHSLAHGKEALVTSHEVYKYLKSSGYHQSTDLKDALRKYKPLRDMMAPYLYRLMTSKDRQNWSIAINIASSGLSISKPEVAKIGALLANQDLENRCHVVEILGYFKPDAILFAQQIGNIFRSGECTSEAVKSISRLGLTSRYAKEISKLLKTPGEYRVEEIEVLSSTRELAKKYVGLISDLLAYDQNRSAAAIAIGTLGSVASGYAEKLIKNIPTSEMQNGREAIFKALVSIGPLKQKEVFKLIEKGFGDELKWSEYRFHSRLLLEIKHGERDPLSLLGKTPTKDKQKRTRKDILATLNDIKHWWSAVGDCPNIQNEIAALINQQVGSISKHWWFPWDKEVLSFHQERLLKRKLSNSSINDALAWITKLELAAATLGVAVLHLLLWVFLLLLYPHSAFVQTFFFWNKPVRKLLGFPYVSWACLAIRPVRQRILMPFKDAIAGEVFDSGYMDLPGLDLSASYYFRGSTVKWRVPVSGTVEVRQGTIVEVIPELKGTIVLIGESGLGKTLFIRQLIEHSTFPIAYIPANRCKGSVLQALSERLNPLTRDENFIEALIYSGGIGLCFDGLNEVTSDTRASIIEFVRSNPSARILLAMQPLQDWVSPGGSDTYELQPLDRESIKDYLLSRREMIESEDKSSRPENRTAISESYEDDCLLFVDSVTGSHEAHDDSHANQVILSNPMDLTTIARMLARSVPPDLHNLQEQQYETMARGLFYTTRRAFRITSFSETVYRMKCEDNPVLPDEAYPDEVMAMLSHKMVYFRKTSSVKRFYFRHDKIMDYFTLRWFMMGRRDSQAGAEEIDLFTAHLNDPRFRGVYFLLALKLPLEEARKLREKIIINATKNNDHNILDRFVQLLLAREMEDKEGPGWADIQVLPMELEIRKQIIAERNNLEIIGHNLEELQPKLNQYSQFKRLLYSSREDQLIPVVHAAFEMLGGTVSPPTGERSPGRDSEDDHIGAPCVFMTNQSGSAYLLYIVTRLSSITQKTLEGMIAHSNPYRTEYPDARHVIVANIQPNLEPPSRVPLILDSDSSFLIKHRLTIVSGVWLFNTLMRFQERKEDSSVIENLWRALDNGGSQPNNTTLAIPTA